MQHGEKGTTITFPFLKYM